MSDPRYEVLRAAMYKIAWPMKAMREEAEAKGFDFEPRLGRALANDPKYLQELAQDAMAKIVMIDPIGVNESPAHPVGGTPKP